ncbi:MAG: hypothetical protein VKN72_02090 [Nostocales cyanobacterium 94392]|nr:hypothetical protein [Nostocales cyanobacterium 94392]
MIASSQQDYITPEEYLQLELESDVKRPRMECFRRSGEGLWLLQSYSGSGETFRLESVGFELEMNLLYEDVVFTG